MSYLVACIFALLAGACLSTQIAVNVELRQGLGHPAIAACASFAVGALALALYALVARLPWPAAGAALKLPAWAWTGGLLGAFYVGSAIALGPRLGAALFVVLVIAGQLVTALLIDQFGWLGTGAHPINAWRLAGAALVVAGVMLIQRH